MKVKVSEATGPVLDHMVAVASRLGDEVDVPEELL